MTEQIEKDFFKTLSYLKNKDPRIYDEKVSFFQEADQSNKPPKKEKGKDQSLYLKDYERNLILNKHFEESEDENESGKRSPTYVEEQEEIKEKLKKALENVDNSDEEDWGGILKQRQKTEQEKKQEEADYKEWLKGHKTNLKNEEEENQLKPLKDYWSNPKLADEEKFLRDYILNKKFLSKEDENYIPTYEEVIHDSDQDLSEDEAQIEKQEEFEQKYNFRFEEPDQDFVI